MTALIPLTRPDRPKLHLIAFSQAGAGGGTYREWGPMLPPGIALWGVRLPGRESRVREVPGTVPELAAEVTAEALTLDGPVAVFGHSFGALMAYAAGRALTRSGRPPVWAGLSGLAPGLARTGLDPDSSDGDLVDAVRRLGPAPEPQLLRLTLPTLRADIRAAHGFLPVRGEPLPCPVSVFGGLDDSLSREDLLAWRGFAAGELILRRYPGGHLHLLEAPRPVVRDICADLRRAA